MGNNKMATKSTGLVNAAKFIALVMLWLALAWGSIKLFGVVFA